MGDQIREVPQIQFGVKYHLLKYTPELTFAACYRAKMYACALIIIRLCTITKAIRRKIFQWLTKNI